MHYFRLKLQRFRNITQRYDWLYRLNGSVSAVKIESEQIRILFRIF